MASIRPFEGVRYDPGVVGDLDQVITPPYDVISPDDQTRYETKSPWNVVRLILPRDNGDKYANAARTLAGWLDSGVLFRDPALCLYVYEQDFELRGERKTRLGFTCLVRLEDYESRTVRPHENIMARHLDDRLNLLRATRSNFDSVFGLYADTAAHEVLSSVRSTSPDAVATDHDGVANRLWTLSDGEKIRRVTEALAAESLIIADGHHRYAAALAYRDEMRQKTGRTDPDAPWEFVMMTLVSMSDPGLVILPTHRLVRGVSDFNPCDFVSRLAEYFDVAEVPASGLEATVEELNSVHLFGLYMGPGRSYVLKLKPSVRPDEAIAGPGSRALKNLDVTVLHSLIIERFLGIGVEQLAAASHVTYTRDVPGAMEAVDRGEQQLLFILNPTRIEEVREVAAHGEKMPQKSTFFYPKLTTGMVMRVMPE